MSEMLKITDSVFHSMYDELVLMGEKDGVNEAMYIKDLQEIIANLTSAIARQKCVLQCTHTITAMEIMQFGLVIVMNSLKKLLLNGGTWAINPARGCQIVFPFFTNLAYNRYDVSR
jgi:hypothetical protein